MRVGLALLSAQLVASLHLATPMLKRKRTSVGAATLTGRSAEAVAAREHFVPDAVAWCVANGALYALTAAEESLVKKRAFAHAPFALFPFDWPRREYDRVRDVQPAMMELYDAVARDGDWLLATLKETIDSDEFTRRLVQLYTDHSKDSGPRQKVSCALIRSDYMLDTKDPKDPRALQVEVNTIASSFGCLSTTISGLHKFIQSRTGGSDNLPANEAKAGLARGLAAAHEEYVAQRAAAAGTGDDMDAPRVVFVVQPNERNQLDQRKLEYELWETHSVQVERITLADLASCASVDEGTGACVVTLPEEGVAFEVSVAYFRSGYSPAEYGAEGKEWRAREVLEGSLAIKCPTIAYQLAGTKKVQQALAAPGALERFCPSGDAEAIREVFAGLYDLDVKAPGAAAAVAAALANPAAYVLKPQREGGGNNYYGTDLKTALETMKPKDRAAYILMDRIVPPPTNATLVRDEKPISGECVAELGIYGTLVTDGSRVIHAESCGHLLRQKLTGVDEGGVAAGFAVLSSPRLV